MHVLHLITGRGPTGPAAAALTDVKALLAAGHQACLATADSPGLIEACRAESLPHVGGLKLGRGVARVFSLPSDIRRLRHIIREQAITVVHVHRSDDQLLASMTIGRQTAIRLVRTWHRDPKSYLRLLCSKLVKQADAYVCVSREYVETLQAAGAARCRFIHAAVDTSVFTPFTGTTTTAPETPPLIAHVGRWKRERDGTDRGQRTALDIFERLPEELAWNGALVGRGEMEEQLRRSAFVDRQLSPTRVRLINFAEQSPKNFARLLSTFSLGLVFTVGSDGASRAGVEMLACGVPLLVADRPGLRELAEDDACALRQPLDDPSSWAQTIRQLLAQPDRLVAMKRAARQRTECAHTLRARGETLAELYRTLFA
ncbi:MAG: glycosyltransferase family 4 protein [Planctomycetota bacterium]